MGKKMSYELPRKSKMSYVLYLSILLLVLTLCLLFLCPNIVNYVVNNALGIRPDSQVFNIWKKTLTPSYLEIYFHNWTNPHDGHNSSIKPRFNEVGPFRFLEVKEKVNITWNDNGTISYRQKKTWQFDEASSCCDLSIQLTTLNAILVTLSHKAEYWSAIVKATLNLGFEAVSPDLFVTKNVSELLFDGYEDHVLSIAKTFPGLSGLPPIDRFGWFYGKNGSSIPDGHFNMDIAASTKGTLRNWNYLSKTQYFDGHCGDVVGSTGEIYQPGQNRDKASFFSPDMCRNIPLDYKEDVQIHGLTGYKYIAYNSMLDNGTIYPENTCYCNGDCMPSGILNISSCRHNSPLFVSLPHFLHADPIYTKNIEGLSSDKDKHQLFVVLEPNTGLPLQAAARIQMNMHLKPVKYMSLINDVPDVIFPIFWFQVEAKASEGFVGKLKLLLNLHIILKWIAVVLVVVSIVMISVSLYLIKNEMKTRTKKLKETVPLRINRDFD